jgi:nucleoside-diphosphate-sugar epimerase
LDLAVFRPFGLYGPDEGSHKFVPMLIGACLEDRRVELTAGKQARDYAFAGDVAEGIFRTMAGDDFPAGEIFNIGSGAAVTIRELGEAVQAAAGGGGELAWGALAYRDGEIMHLTVDTGKASAVLGWRAKTALRDGLGLTVDAIRNEA